MSSPEGFSNSTEQPRKLSSNESFEMIQEWKERIDSILYRELTVDNIETFADQAADDLVNLNEEILQASNQSENGEVTAELEDAVYESLGLPPVGEILAKIGKVGDRIKKLKENLEQATDETGEVLIPPQEDKYVIRNGSNNGFEKPDLVPRLLTLAYILETDFGLGKDDIRATKGQVREEMVREQPYVRVEVPDLKRVVYICDEEGNASYIFDTEVLNKHNLPLDEIDINDKGELQNLINSHPGVGKRIIQTKYWRRNISNILSEPISVAEVTDSVPEERTSEFVKTKEQWPSFEDFQQEVRDAYPGEGGIEQWYREERKKRTEWPAAPSVIYKDRGWEGWPELVGKENRLKKEWPSFHDFQQEVASLFPGYGNIQKWYKDERRNHPSWPATPPRVYAKHGWQGWPELVGKENQTKKEYLSFEDFKKAVQEAYPGQGSVWRWFREEVKKHSDWHSNPTIFYKEDGWVSLPDILGVENHLVKEWLPFQDFQQEVRALYSGESNIEQWYHEERRANHQNWPSSPEDIYGEHGWVSWPSLVGKE